MAHAFGKRQLVRDRFPGLEVLRARTFHAVARVGIVVDVPILAHLQSSRALDPVGRERR